MNQASSGHFSVKSPPSALSTQRISHLPAAQPGPTEVSGFVGQRAAEEELVGLAGSVPGCSLGLLSAEQMGALCRHTDTIFVFRGFHSVELFS